MEFVTMQELEEKSAKVWSKIEAGVEVAITRDGAPFALMIPTRPEDLESTLHAIRAVRAERFDRLLRKMHAHAERVGLSAMTMEEIDAEIALARKERRERNADSS